MSASNPVSMSASFSSSSSAYAASVSSESSLPRTASAKATATGQSRTSSAASRSFISSAIDPTKETGKTEAVKDSKKIKVAAPNAKKGCWASLVEGGKNLLDAIFRAFKRLFASKDKKAVLKAFEGFKCALTIMFGSKEKVAASREFVKFAETLPKDISKITPEMVKSAKGLAYVKNYNKAHKDEAFVGSAGLRMYVAIHIKEARKHVFEDEHTHAAVFVKGMEFICGKKEPIEEGEPEAVVGGKELVFSSAQASFVLNQQPCSERALLQEQFAARYKDPDGKAPKKTFAKFIETATNQELAACNHVMQDMHEPLPEPQSDNPDEL